MRIRSHTVVVVCVLLAATLSGARRAEACTCVIGPTDCQLLSTADAVFEGTVASTELTPVPPSPDDVPLFRYSRSVSLRDVRPLRGQSTNTVLTARHSESCGYDFRPGVRYLIVAHRLPDGRLVVSSCGLTRPLSDAPRIIDYVESLVRAAQTRVWGRVSMPVRWRDFVADTTGVAGTRITLDGPERRSIVTDADGRYSFTGLRHGSYVISAALPASLPQLGIVEPVSFDLDAAHSHACAEVNFFAPIRSSISGTVVDERGRLLEGAFVDLRLADQANLTRGAAGAGAVTDANGRYEFTDLPPGRYLIGFNTRIGPSPGSPYVPVAAQTSEGHPIASLDFGGSIAMAPMATRQLTRVTVLGIVRDRAGNPVPGVSLSPTMLDDQNRVYPAAHVVSDKDGRFRLTLWLGQRYRVTTGTGSRVSAEVEFLASDAPLLVTLID